MIVPEGIRFNMDPHTTGMNYVRKSLFSCDDGVWGMAQRRSAIGRDFRKSLHGVHGTRH